MGDVEDSRLLSDVRWLVERLGELPEPVAEPAFIAVSGLPGTGKSYFCRRLVERLPSIILESDALRKELFPQPLCGGYLPRYYTGGGQGGAGGRVLNKTRQGVKGI